MESDEADSLTLMLAGDVMTGRGIDQVLAHPAPPQLHEAHVHDARDYVRLAERVHGPIPAPVAADYVWGDALPAIAQAAPDLRIVNLETAVTARGRHWPGKAVHYRMHPANIGCLTAAGLDVCALANNHLLDWGLDGLADSLQALATAGLGFAGAGPDLDSATAPAVRTLSPGHRLLVCSWAAPDCGVPEDWAATASRPGVALLKDLERKGLQQVQAAVEAQRRAGDLVLLTIHWGANWVDQVPEVHRRFAHALIERGLVDLVHGHSSHHPLPFELHCGKLVLYGCGDLINDYEGIHPRMPDQDAARLYFATLSPASGRLLRLQVVSLRRRQFRLVRDDGPADQVEPSGSSVPSLSMRESRSIARSTSSTCSACSIAPSSAPSMFATAASRVSKGPNSWRPSSSIQ